MIIELEGVNKVYNQGQLNEVMALTDISFTVEEGSLICLQGPSGSGKSTLLGIIGCAFPPTSGKAEIGGKKISRLPDNFLTRHRRETIGFIFQRFNLLEELSVLDNVSLPLLPLGISPGIRKKMTLVLLDKLHIRHRASFPAGQISGGELQRVAIARALIHDPPIVLADEPTAHLDQKLSYQLMDIMGELKDEGKTIIITSHDPLVSSHDTVDSIKKMRDGRIVTKLTTGD
jgi:putative ABC transport system ATP-binding protein